MPTVLRFRRGDTTASNAFTGAEGELFVDTTKDTVVVHDGITAGGKPLATEAALNSALAGKADASALTSGLAGKQDTLVSGTNIKTVNGTSLLGSGNIVISGGGGGGGDLTQVSSDIVPLIDEIYDIGSSTNRFYDVYLGNKLDISGGTLSGTTTLVSAEVPASGNIPYSPAVYDYTLSSNATLVAPSLAVDSSLVGGLYTEGTTITPEHILGTYTDTKGTLTIDGSLKVNDAIESTGVLLKQHTIDIGTVTSKTSQIVTGTSTLSKYDDWQTLLGTNAFYINNGNFSLGGDFVTGVNYTFGKDIKIGSVLRIRYTDPMNPSNIYYWDLQISNMSYSMMMMSTVFYYTEISTNAPFNAFSYFGNGMNNVGRAGYAMMAVDLSMQSSVTEYTLTLDGGAIALTSGAKILVNSLTASPPVTVTKSINTAYSSVGWSSAGNIEPGIVGFTYNSSLANLNTLPELIRTTIEIFSNGNSVTMVYPGYGTSVYTVSNAGLRYGMMGGADSAWGFALTFVSGYDFVGSSGFNDSIQGGPYNQMNVSASVTTSTNYTTTRLAQFVASTSSDNKYKSSTNWNWLNIGDKLSYIPTTTSIKFSKDDGTSVVAISYNNSTGALTYGGLVIPESAIALTSTNLKSSNSGSVTGTGSSVIIGESAYASGSSNAVIIGTLAHTADNNYSVAIGRNAQINSYASSSVAIGPNTNVNMGASNAVAIGDSAYAGSWASGVIALGASASSSSSGAVAIGNYASSSGGNSIALGNQANAQQSNNIALGFYAKATGVNTFSRMSTGNSAQLNQTIEIVRWSPYFNLTNQTKCIGIGNDSTSDLNYVYLPDQAFWQKTTIYGTSNVIIRDVAENTNRYKVVEIKFLAKTTSAYQYSITQLSATVLDSGTDTTWNNAITPSIAASASGPYLEFKIANSTTTSYDIGAVFKTTLLVLTV